MTPLAFSRLYWLGSGVPAILHCIKHDLSKFYSLQCRLAFRATWCSGSECERLALRACALSTTY